jgi:hypothetical protein
MISRFLRARSVLGTLCLVLSASALTGCKSGGGANDVAGASTPVPGVNAPVGSSPSPAPSSGSANVAPTISGSAVAAATLNSPYSFAPVANDPNGDQLTFQIQNKPTWATFSTVSGRLSGTPTVAGTFANIVISATDGRASVALPSFSITVKQAQNAPGATLAWVAPTQNVDGSTLTNLAGFVIAYGQSREALTETVRIANPSVDSFTFDQLPAGNYYFGVKAYTAAGVESDLSAIVSKRIG